MERSKTQSLMPRAAQLGELSWTHKRKVRLISARARISPLTPITSVQSTHTRDIPPDARPPQLSTHQTDRGREREREKEREREGERERERQREREMEERAVDRGGMGESDVEGEGPIDGAGRVALYFRAARSHTDR